MHSTESMDVDFGCNAPNPPRIPYLVFGSSVVWKAKMHLLTEYVDGDRVYLRSLALGTRSNRLVSVMKDILIMDGKRTRT